MLNMSQSSSELVQPNIEKRDETNILHTMSLISSQIMEEDGIFVVKINCTLQNVCIGIGNITLYGMDKYLLSELKVWEDFIVAVYLFCVGEFNVYHIFNIIHHVHCNHLIVN